MNIIWQSVKFNEDDIVAIYTRGYICIERDDEYYRRATERVRQHGQA